MNNIRPFLEHKPQIDSTAYIDSSAIVIGRVSVAEDASLWPCVVARGDVERIEIGRATNVQDGTVLHVTHDGPYSPGGRALLIGEGTTIGHQALLHACTVGDYCLIGMGAIVMDKVVVEDECMIAAGAVVPPGKRVSSRTLWRGNPARPVRELSQEEVRQLHYSAEHYVRIKDQHQQSAQQQ